MTDIKMLYVMRHGETEDNISKTITAQADSPLTILGRKQAVDKGILLREFVGDLDSLAFVSSPLHRTCVTMELARDAAGLAVQPYCTDQRLMEMDFGTWTKRLEGDDRIAPDSPTAHEQWDLQPPGGESQAMVYARAGHFLGSISCNSVIVCHARVLCMIRSHVLNLTPEETMRFEPPNAGFMRLSGLNEDWFGAHPSQKLSTRG
jgi:probable phosphoglycerate mutase